MKDHVMQGVPKSGPGDLPPSRDLGISSAMKVLISKKYTIFTI